MILYSKTKCQFKLYFKYNIDLDMQNPELIKKF